MATKVDKKNVIRQGITEAEIVYFQNLAGKTFLYVCGDEYFDARHVYANAKRKLPCLKRLPELTNEMVCVLKNMETMTITYKLSVTNLEFTGSVTRKPKRYTGKKD